MHALVVGDNVLLREGLKWILRSVDERAHIIEAANARQALELAEKHSDLRIILLGESIAEEQSPDVVRTLHESYPGVPLIVLASSATPTGVKRCIGCGASGVLLLSSSAGAMLGALRLVLSGGVYVPPEILLGQEDASLTEGPSEAGDAASLEVQRAIAKLGLAGRQAQVLAGIMHGKTNKQIAREIGLAEQTVKAHSSALFRALGVNNRTQAAMAVAQLRLKAGVLPRGKR